MWTKMWTSRLLSSPLFTMVRLLITSSNSLVLNKPIVNVLKLQAVWISIFFLLRIRILTLGYRNHIGEQIQILKFKPTLKKALHILVTNGFTVNSTKEFSNIAYNTKIWHLWMGWASTVSHCGSGSTTLYTVVE
jgi:hypothetical protein